MGKKRKELDASSVPQNDNVPSGSDIFKTLFGNVEQNSVVSSIFSDNNPFKRKLQDSSLGLGNANSSENPEINKSNIDEGKRKRNKGKKFDLEEEEEATENPLVSKKSKEVKSRKPEFEESPNIVSDLDKSKKNPSLLVESKAERKKRKRDEVEREYEVQKYGSVAEEVENVVVVGEKRKKLENETDMLTSKEEEGFDDESKLLRTVFVGNLPLKVKKKLLIKEFKQFGEIESVRIRSVPIVDTKIPRKGAILLKKLNDSADSVHAYIVFKTEHSAEASLAHNMAVVGGNHIRVDRACPPRKKLKGEGAPLYDNKRTLFVGNLPFDVKDEEIYQLFSGIKEIESSVEAVRVIRHPHIGLGKGIAYVLFKTKEAANLVLKKRNLKIRDRELRLSHSKQDSTPSKRRNVLISDSPTKRLAMDSRTPDRNSGSNTKASTSYQGLRASKTGVYKKVRPQTKVSFKTKSKTQVGEKRMEKRPAVAARKAKANAFKDGGTSKQAGKKRKLDGRTPDSTRMKKKTKNFG
ncbi:hypothetical protein JCGZ_09337 [Jatropha curcas]|uniref:RRM domain-containing protein n=1 Tax=Jatropha curcas TaxID=180498 RepID=A0A067KJT8_JATCU|nr:hypothetical protein JCGZ_09337 [Jatropha curcas]